MATKRASEESNVGGAPGPRGPSASDDDRSADSSARVPVESMLAAHADFRQGTDLTALALAARARDPGATRAFLEATVATVRGICRNVLGAGHAELDDTIQECLVEILRALPHYRAKGPAANYAKQIALHCAMGVRRRGRNRARRLRRLVEESSVQTLDVHAEFSLSLRLVRDVIDDLPTVQAEAILMRSVLGFSLEEIALATQVSVNTAKSRLRVAKESLRRQLDQEGAAGLEEEDG